MREIKFRAWDKKLEIMHKKVGLLDFDEWWLRTSISGGVVGERHSFKNEETDRFILEQFTGLSDKNGKEIFEGDIVETGVNAKQEVVWREGKWQYRNIGGEDYASFYRLASDMIAPEWKFEVIGTIHDQKGE